MRRRQDIRSTVLHADAALPSRRAFFRFGGSLLLCSSLLFPRMGAQAASEQTTILSAPIDIEGDWGGSLPASALRVVMRMRDVCLSGVDLVSDRQPDRIRIDDHSSGPPNIWLHDDPPKTAWIIVDIGGRAWCQLAYQFGHELGHVLCNSWQRTAKPQPPSQWLEESLVEAFSIRGLGLLATSWEQSPPFAGDNAYSAAIRQYRQNVIDNYSKAVDRASYTDLGDWLKKARGRLEKPGVGLNPLEGPAVLAILAELERDRSCVADMGALNRWPERTAVALEDYLNLWAASCSECHASGRLPATLRTLFRLNGGSK